MRLNLNTGIDRYYGLLPLAEEYGIFKKADKRFELPDGSKHFESAIYKEPERFFTKEILDRLDEAAKDKYSIGSGNITTVDSEEDDFPIED
jgi:hypothetical protein